MQQLDVEFCIAHPEGYDLNPNIVKETSLYYNQEEAFKDADFVYAKNWSSYKDYWTGFKHQSQLDDHFR